jgi:hypothetical protein
MFNILHVMLQVMCSVFTNYPSGIKVLPQGSIILYWLELLKYSQTSIFIDINYDQ